MKFRPKQCPTCEHNLRHKLCIRSSTNSSYYWFKGESERYCYRYRPKVKEPVPLIKDASEVTAIWDITNGVDPAEYVREMRDV